MFKRNKFSPIPTSRVWMMIAISSIVLLVTACGSSVTPSANPTVASGAVTTSSKSDVVPTQDTSSAITSSNSAEACTLLTKNDISKILGEDVVDARQPSPDGSICEYQTKNLIFELTTFHKFGGFANSVQYMEGIRTNGIGDSPVDVPGLGDEAFYHGSSLYRLLQARKGDTVYGFGVRNVTSDQSISSPDNAQALEKAVADLLFSRLP